MEYNIDGKEMAVKVCPSCSEPIAENAKFCAECGHKIAEEKSEKPVKAPQKSVKMPEKKEETVKAETKKTVKMPKSEEESDEQEEEPAFDYKDIDPETDWACYGQIEPEHFECEKCQFREPCAKKSGVKL